MSDPLLPIGTNRCLCSGCGRYFTAPTAFDKHQRTAKDGTTVCHDPADRGLIYDGRYWGGPKADEAARARMARVGFPKPVGAAEGADPMV